MGFAKDMPTAKTQHPERRENERLLVDLRFISNPVMIWLVELTLVSLRTNDSWTSDVIDGTAERDVFSSGSSDNYENVVVDLCANMIKYCVLEEEDDDSDNFPLNNCRESVFILSEESDR